VTDLADWAAPAGGLAAGVSTPVKGSDTGQPPKEHELRAKLERDHVDVNQKLQLRELHYNIQIVLPESRDVAVFDAIFESLRRHLL
jgi:hypothetical protein